MKIKYCFLPFLLVSVFNLFAQSSFTDFKRFFEEVKFDYLHVYSEWNNNDSEYPKGSLYSFKGNKIDSSYYSLFHSQILKSNSKYLLYDVPTGDYYAGIYRFLLSETQEAFIIRGHSESMREQPIYCLVYDFIKHEFVQSIELADFFGYESAFGNKEAWLLDLNEDGVLDILTRSWMETTTLLANQDVKIEETDSLRVFVWNQNEFVTKEVNSISFLRQKFTLRVIPSLTFPEQQKLTMMLNGSAHESKQHDYFLVLGETKNLKEAIIRKQELGNFDRTEYLYLADKQLEIYFYDGYYFTVMKGFLTENDVKIALIEAKEKIHRQVYIQNEEKWCSQRMELNCIESRACFYQCKQ